MPKDVIRSMFHGRSVPMVGEIPDSIRRGKSLSDSFVEVGWTRGLCDVQLGSINPEASDDPNDPLRGQFVHLDREGINRLIRSLRKARDQAFGADA